jgi:hypothetical protein
MAVKETYEIKCRSGTGKSVTFTVSAISHRIAHHELRVQMAKRFKGKTYKVVAPIRKVG